MRRSKSNPAKYAKNYRKISQRQMTNGDKDDRHEIKRIETLLREQNDIVGPSQPEIKERKPSKRMLPSPSSNQQSASVLSKELMNEANDGYGETADDNAMVLLPKKKKKNTEKKPKVTVTAEEIKQAHKERKQLTRKLQQLQQRAAQKERRASVYAQLQSTAVSNTLLQSSATLGQTATTKQRLRRAKQKESVGLELTTEEQELLYRRQRKRSASPPSFAKDPTKESNATDTKRRRKSDAKEEETEEKAVPQAEAPSQPINTAVGSEPVDDTTTTTAPNKAAPISLAAQMMDSLNSLKQNNAAAESCKNATSLEEEINQNPNPSKKQYVPSEPIAIKTTPSYSTAPPPSLKPTVSLPALSRPPDVVTTRSELPVVAMELEVMDAIQQNEVVILCGETGSGKSTQVPQFLYENKRHCPVAITQPRRVAAVATAKRVAYELTGCRNMGRGDAIVAYTTRYETAGLGPSTRVTYMTDGILLQEVRRDLLLRKYNTVILDEAHERNLNTDVLIGLLRLALPLRRQAEELPPLKLIVMSATLRVQDFTGIFPEAAVVQVPGRTHPVTIHHSRETELDKYEDVVFQKTCKIHRKLPPGGVLVFLTGKHEIVRMVGRLDRALHSNHRTTTRPIDAVVEEVPLDDSSPRDMDDDEVDGDLYGPDDVADEAIFAEEASGHNEAISGSSLKAHILPLYSLLASEEQAKVFAPVPEGHRLIVVATNIAETSLTIPGISYVVDSGRQKALNYSNNGVASYNVTWISQAAADQRAGRAGRTGPGHCYRVFSSSLYSRHMDKYEIPEILCRPLEDVVLSMKAMAVSNIAEFPFPTPPDRGQIHSAVKLLANLGCLDMSNPRYEDGEINRLGSAVSKLPLGVRHGKMLLVAAEAGVVDYAIAMISILSEPTSPFVVNGQAVDSRTGVDRDVKSESACIDDQQKFQKPRLWSHKDGDILAAVQAVGAYSFAGEGVGRKAGATACRNFCEENGLHSVVMQRIQTMRKHLARLVKTRLPNVDGVAPKTGKFPTAMKPPSLAQIDLLRQSITSGLLDNVAMLAPLGSIPGEHPYSLRSAYISCSSHMKEPLFMDRNSVLFSRDSRELPKWICYEKLTRKTLKDGSSVAIMKRTTSINSSWLGFLATGSKLLSLGDPIPTPQPVYNKVVDEVQCSVRTVFGNYGWEISPVRRDMYSSLQCIKSPHFGSDDSFRWFARFLLEGKVFDELESIHTFLIDAPNTITLRTSSTKATLLVAALASEGVDSAHGLCKHWATVNDKFLFRVMKRWVKEETAEEFKHAWVTAVKANTRRWRAKSKCTPI